MTEQFNSGESSFIFEINFHKTNIGRMIVGKYAWQQEEDEKRRYQYCSDISGTIVYFGALQGHSGRSLIDPSLQEQCDNAVWILPTNFDHQQRIDTWR